jgi:hypothetical protein
MRRSQNIRALEHKGRRDVFKIGYEIGEQEFFFRIITFLRKPIECDDRFGLNRNAIRASR